MSVLKKYNNETQQWEPINQASAVGVLTDNPLLTSEENPIRSIEDVLLQNKQEIDLLRKNVSWLALHGGGGAGGGSGSIGSNEAVVQIFDPIDNSTETNNIVWNSNYSNILFKVSSNTSTSTYTVYIRVNGSLKSTLRDVKRNTLQSINANAIGLGKGDASLSIVAMDKDENEFSANCKITIASVTISEISSQTFTQDILVNGQPTLPIYFKTSVAGNYKMYYSSSNIYYDETNGWCDGEGPLEDSNTKRSQYIDVLNLGTSYTSLTINMNNIYGSTDPNNIVTLLPQNVVPGSYIRYFKLVNAENNNVYSETKAARIVVVPAAGLLVIPTVGTSSTDRYTVTADSVLYVRFVTYNGSSSTGTYSFNITINGKKIPLDSNQSEGKTFGTTISVPINVSSYPEIFTGPGNYDVVITATQTPNQSSGTCYVTINEQSTDVVRKYLEYSKNNAILDLTFWDNTWNQELSNTSSHIQFNNDNFDYNNTELNGKVTHKAYVDFYNIGADSGLGAGAGEGVFYKFSHTAAAKVTFDNSVKTKIFPSNNKDSDALIPGYIYDFSLQVAYSLDEIVDDNSTVFNMGNYNIETGLGYGVLITAHNYYVKIDDTIMTGAMQDSSFTQFDLVCFMDSLGVRWIYIYQNGVLLQAAKHITSSSGYTLAGINEMTLACKSITGEGKDSIVIDSVNSNFYCVRLYNKKINDGEIVCSYANNYANYKRDKNTNSLDPEVISNLLNYNSINSDKVVDNNIAEGKEGRISEVYDFKTGQYDWGVNYAGTWQLGAISDIPNKCNIPVITLTSTWSYSDFIKVNQDMVEASGVFTYIAPGDGEPITAEVTMVPQGTTTLGYEIKNVDITFKNNLMFSPKDTWFPEQTFTLKADVVDSAHVNNAAIGTFVNDCFNNDTDGTLLNKTAFRGATLINNYKNASKTLPKTLTFKPTIEGFPVVLVVAFANGDGTYTTKVLGIYSFNLGRASYYNQGMKILTRLRDQNNNILQPDSAVFPGLFRVPEASDIDKSLFSCCFEGTRSMNTTEDAVALESETYDYAIVMVSGVPTWYPMAINLGGYVSYDGSHYIFDDAGEMIPWSNDTVTKMKMNENGYFWSPDPSFATNLFDLKYDGGDQQTAWNLFSATQDGGYDTISLCNCITRKMPYKKGSILRDWSTQMTKWQITSSSSSDALTLIDSGTTFASERPQQPEQLEISFKNSEFYYCVCMLFGLIDNFGKNMQFKYWGDGGKDSKGNYTNQYNTWSPTFYDMDTALGVSNTGSEDVPPTVFDESIINLPDNRVRFLFGQAPNTLNGFEGTKANPTFTVYSNKLWGALEHHQMYENYSVDDGTTQTDWRTYAKMWHNLRSKFVTNVEDLLDKYFTKNLEKCGQFLYNYDYYTKYLNTAQYAMLHGTRITFIRNWLKARIAFLDSVFGYKSKYDFNDTRIGDTSLTYLISNNLKPYNTSWNNSINIKHNAIVNTFPIKTNKSLIVQSTVGGNIYTYTYCPKNTENNIVFADSSSAQGIQTMINNSDCIIDLPNLRSVGLLTMTHNNGLEVTNTLGNNVYDSAVAASAPEIYYQLGSLSSLKKLDLSNIGTINGSIELFKLFKTWDESGWGGTPRAFALEELNLSNTSTNLLKADLSGVTVGISNIPEIYRSPFTNLSTIDISNSKVGSINIPEGVTLKELKIENSYVSKVKLDQQPLMESISFDKCYQLSDLELTNCSKLSSVLLNNTNIQIQNITISNCDSIKSINIDLGGKCNYVPVISISNCPNLEVISIRGCYKENYNSDNVLEITQVPNLKELTVSNSYYTAIFWDGAENLTKLGKLDISSSRISRIDNIRYKDNTDRNFIDLRGFKSDTFINEDGNVYLNFKKNTTITHVYFDNVKIVEDHGKYKIHVPSPFVLNMEECFGDCSNLERVYGYIHVAGPRIFNKCKKFYINNLKGKNVKDQIIRTGNTLGLQQVENTFGNHGDYVDLTAYSTTWDNIIITKDGGRFIHPTDSTLYVEYGNKYYYDLLRRYDNKFRCAWLCHNPKLINTTAPFSHNFAENEDGLYVQLNDTWEIYNSTNSNHNGLQRYSCLEEGQCTNLMISGVNVSGAFTETACNDWDVYYTLFNCDSDNEEDSINISSLFSGCEGLSFGWYGDPKSNENSENNSNDNSPNRFTFMNCHRASAASGVFSVKSLSRIKSPYIAAEKDTYGYPVGVIVPGLYTPLKNNCKVLGRPVSGQSIMDRNVLRTLSDDKFIATSISNLTCKNFVDDVNNITFSQYTNSGKTDDSGNVYDNFITGNVNELLMDCPNITTVNKLLNGIAYLDYDTVCGSGKIYLPKLTSIYNSFITSTASGRLILKDMYNDVEDCKYLTGIYSSFVNESADEDVLELEFNNDLFNSFENLIDIASDPEENEDIDSFSGEGLHKYISNNGFPYQLFEKCTKLKRVISLFQGLDCTKLTTGLNEDGIGLPGDLFKNCPELEEIPRLFYNMKTNIPAYLTSDSFINCPNIKNVAYAFACDATGILSAFRTASYITTISGKNLVQSKQPYIPERLFYHGEIKSSIYIVGSNYTEEVNDVNYQSSTGVWTKVVNGSTRTYSGNLEKISDNVIKINPATIIKENGKQIYLVSNNSNNADTNLGVVDTNPKLVTLNINIPRTNISNMEGCFQGGDWSEYIAPYNRTIMNNMPAGEFEVKDAEDYNPFLYVLNNGVWSVNNKYQPCTKTLMWEYDGDWKSYDKLVNSKLSNMSGNLLMLDDAYNCETKNTRFDYSSISATGMSNNIEMTFNTDGSGRDLILTGNFCCAPDLLRYCGSSVNVKKLFANCGPTTHTYVKSDSTRYGIDSPVDHYGLKGRLVPYMFKPVSTISNISNMFTHCKFIGSYVKDFITTDSEGNTAIIPYAYPIPESFVKYLTSRNLDMSNTFMGWYFPAYTNLNVFKKNTTCTYTLVNTFKWPLFSNRICTNPNIEAAAYVDYPATEVTGIFNDGSGYIRASNVAGVFNLSQQDSDNESNTTLVRNQSVKFGGIFSAGGYTMGTDTYCFAGYTDPAVAHGNYPAVVGATRFGTKTVRNGGENDRLYRNYVVYKDKPLY